MRFNFRHIILTIMLPFSKALGKVHAPWSRKKVKARQVELFLKHAKPGDVILTRTMGELTNFAIKGYFKHTAMYVGGNNVCESISPETCITNIYDFLMSKDAVCLLRPNWLTIAERERAAEIMVSLCGLPYDYMFDPGEKAFYCAESVWFSLNKAGGENIQIFKRRKTMGTETVLPQDFYAAKSKFELIAAYPLMDMPER